MGTQVVINQPDPEGHERNGNLLISQANQIAVSNNEDREVAAAFVVEIRETIQRIEAEFNGTEDNPGPVSLAHKAWKSGVALRDRALKSFITAKGMIEAKIKRYEYDIEQKRQEEARKAEALARKKAEELRAQQISEAKKTGDREAVQNLKDAPLTVFAAAPKTQEVPKVEGLRRSAPVWKWRVTNEALIPRKYLMIDDTNISGTVRAQGAKACIPGISVYDARAEL